MTLSSNNPRNVCPSGTLSADLKGCALNSPASSIARAKPAAVRVRPQTETNYCPIQAFDNYVRYRGKSPGYLFVWPSGDPVSRTQFASTLNLCLSFAGLSTTIYINPIPSASEPLHGQFPRALPIPNSENGTLVLRCFQTLRSPPLIDQTVIFWLLGAVSRWPVAFRQGPACHWPVLGGAVSQVSLSV